MLVRRVIGASLAEYSEWQKAMARWLMSSAAIFRGLIPRDGDFLVFAQCFRSRRLIADYIFPIIEKATEHIRATQLHGLQLALLI